MKLFFYELTYCTGHFMNVCINNVSRTGQRNLAESADFNGRPSAVQKLFLFHDRITIAILEVHGYIFAALQSYFPVTIKHMRSIYKLVTTIYNQGSCPTACLCRPEDFSPNFWRIYRIFLVMALFYYRCKLDNTRNELPVCYCYRLDSIRNEFILFFQKIVEPVTPGQL